MYYSLLAFMKEAHKNHNAVICRPEVPRCLLCRHQEYCNHENDVGMDEITAANAFDCQVFSFSALMIGL
jgi:hypothetical protein